MQYKSFKDEVQISRLGMGNMRLPVKTDVPGEPVDYERAKAIVDAAVAAGVNYFDTAYIYHNGESEGFTGRALAEYPRDSYFVADKFNFQAQPDYRAQFAEQLERLGLDRIDFYLLHGIQDYFSEDIIASGCIEYFDRMKREGKIRWLGFSFHGSIPVLKRMLDIYDWDFVQIQLNYYDWYCGEAREQYEILHEAGIPVMVMEPVHGGMLAKLEPEAEKLLKYAAPEASAASWAMRFVLGLEGVQVVLSGMSDIEQLTDNAATFSACEPLKDVEQTLVKRVCEIQHASVAVACTGCRYCTPNCPKGLDIPRLLKAYNDAKIGGTWRLTNLVLPEDEMPGNCIGCGACASHCPQSFRIPDYLKELDEMVESLKG